MSVRGPKARHFAWLVALLNCFLQGAAAGTATDSIAPRTGAAWPLPLPGGTTLTMVWIAPGTFTMGSPTAEAVRDADEGPQTQVTISTGFWLGRTPVTIGQWQAVMGVNVREQLRKTLQDSTLHDFGGHKQTVRDYMHFSRDADPGEYLANESDDLPMYFVSWIDAAAFCEQLNEREHAAGRLPARYRYTLPTEAQWEYAARAGTVDATYAGPLTIVDGHAPALDDIAWYDANSPDGYPGKGFPVRGRTGGPRVVAQKRPNAWGLYDMAGNLWEWCLDWYGPYPGGSVVDPAGPATGTGRVNRGGSFGSGARDERSAKRATNPPAEASAYRGLRLALASE